MVNACFFVVIEGLNEINQPQNSHDIRTPILIHLCYVNLFGPQDIAII